MTSNFQAFLYLVSSVCFIMALKGLSSAKTSKTGNLYGMVGMFIAIGTTLISKQIHSFGVILTGIAIGGVIGMVIAQKIKMTALPQLVAGFHSLVGLAAVFVAVAAYLSPKTFGIGTSDFIYFGSMIEMSVGAIIGAITFSGSVVAFGKLQGLIPGKPFTFKGQHMFNLILGAVIFLIMVAFVFGQSLLPMILMISLSFLLGVLLIIPIGGADMPVIVSMLNSYSGWAAVGIGFTLNNILLIITGSLVGASGAILSYIMCKAMNRSFISVILGGFGGEAAGAADQKSLTPQQPVKSGSAEDAAFLLGNAQKVIIVPGYGMAVAQAQHSLREMADQLKKRGIVVKYAIHPVAGRMPGHMNVLLAEANVPYEEVFELEDINSEFATADVAFVIGANDITNPAAKTDRSSPIYGMPILDVEKAKTVLFVKRSMAAGYAGVENELFYRPNTMMLFSDAKKICDDINKEIENV